MRWVMAFSALLLILACQDQDPVRPDIEATPEMSLAQAAEAQGDLEMMVPLSLEGTFWVDYFGPGSCEGSDGNFRMEFSVEGTGTHLGRLSGSGVNCYDPTFVFLSQTSTLTAANGDELHSYGSPGMGTGGTAHSDGSATTGPIFVVDGTGRFENAEGSYDLWVSTTTGEPGTFRVDGWISSVGSSK